MTTENFVDQLYDRILGRKSDVDGRAYWVSEIESNRISASDITLSFINSQEFSGAIVPVAMLYATVFGRLPDPEGLNFWVGQLQSGRTLLEISNAFIASDEYKENYGETESHANFLLSLYKSAFG